MGVTIIITMLVSCGTHDDPMTWCDDLTVRYRQCVPSASDQDVDDRRDECRYKGFTLRLVTCLEETSCNKDWDYMISTCVHNPNDPIKFK